METNILIKSFFYISTQPARFARELTSVENSLARQVLSRSIFALQAVINLIALSVILLLGLSESAFYAMTCKGGKAKKSLSTTAVYSFASLVSIPACLLKIVSTEKIAQSYLRCLRRVCG